MNAPGISVITVCRNARKELPGAANSVLTALGAQDEWVVQDGASTDGSQVILAGLEDARVHVESQPDGGIYDALNQATARACGDFMLILGADDRLRLRLDEVRPRLQDAHTVYYGDVLRMVTGDRYAGFFNGAKLARTNICQQAVFYPRAVFAGRSFDVRYRQQADWVFNMDCFADPTLKFEYLPLIIADYAQGGASSLRLDDAFQRDYLDLLKKYFTFRQRWRPALASVMGRLFRSLPGIPPPRQTPARKR